jgi:hypothetical protein
VVKLIEYVKQTHSFAPGLSSDTECPYGVGRAGCGQPGDGRKADGTATRSTVAGAYSRFCRAYSGSGPQV